MINLWAAMYIIAWMTMPFMSIGTSYRVLAIIATMIWILTIRKINPQVFVKAKNVIVIGILYCCLTFGGTFLLFDSLSKAISDTVNPFIVLIVFLFYYGYYGTIFFKKIVYFSLVCFLVVGIMSVRQLYIDPRAARDAYLTWMEGEGAAYTTIGTYGFIMSSALMCPVLLAVFLVKKIQDDSKLFLGVVLAILFIMVLMSGYTIAVITMTVSFLVFVCVHDTSTKKKLFVILCCCVLIFIWKPLVENVLLFLIDVTRDNVVYNERMRELYRSLVLGLEAVGDLAARQKRYTATINEIIKNPIFGAAILKGRYNGGGHSEYLDTMGRFGLFYFACNIWITLLKPLKNAYAKETKALCWCFGIGMVVLCTLDTYSYVQMIVAVIILPYIADIVKKGKAVRLVNRVSNHNRFQWRRNWFE
ncbi:MAG: hypothetical protein IJE23_03460 [Tyzzerella sp.]|nr:hypothetical protein [Tyzzerella sp.]